MEQSSQMSIMKKYRRCTASGSVKCTVFLNNHSGRKKKRLNDEFDIAMTVEFESEVRDMCNLSQALVEQGIEQGIEQGVDQKNMSLVKLMLEDNEPIDKIVKYTDYPVDKIKKIAESMGKRIAI